MSLKDLISKEEWQAALAKSNNQLSTTRNKTDNVKGEVDGVNIGKLKQYMTSNANTIVDKVVKYLYGVNHPVTVAECIKGTSYGKSEKEFESNIRSGSSLKSKYGKLWIHQGNMIELNPNIRQVIDAFAEN